MIFVDVVNLEVLNISVLAEWANRADFAL